MRPSTGNSSVATMRVVSATLWLAALSAMAAGGAGMEQSLTGKSGTLGSDLCFLAAHHRGPETLGESNHFIDLWAGQPTRTVAFLHGLTNNRTLFINSHSEGIKVSGGVRHAFRPHASLLRKGQSSPRYSAADLASVLSSESAAQIHNIVTAGCDEERSFSAAELRKAFIRATNIVHVAAGEPGFQPMFFQAIANHSRENQPIYETAMLTRTGTDRYHMSSTPSAEARKLTPYIAELFRPGEPRPFRVQTAGRELLDPSFALPRPGTP